jgi:TPR repeat protein
MCVDVIDRFRFGAFTAVCPIALTVSGGIMRRFFSRLLGSISLIILFAFHASAEGRWALVLAVSDYENPSIPSLTNTVNDGRTMAGALNQMGFDVYYIENASREAFDREMDRLLAEQTDSDLGMFFFAGHGLQVGGTNYALPSDISPTGDSFFQDQAISVGDVVQRLKATGTENLVVVLDACRNSPFPNSDAAGTGLALVDAPENTIIAYSTAPGELALDGTAGANSPYTAALATALEGPEQDIRDVLRLVRARVRLATGGSQTPWFVDNSKGEMLIQPGRRSAPEIELPELEYDQVSLAATAWWTIANSADPRDFETFIESFPEAEQTGVAQRQLRLVAGDAKVDFPLLDLGVPSRNPEVPGGLNSHITACDILATGLQAPMNLVEPVPHDLVNERAALRACTTAVRDDPENPRLLDLLARVLFLHERYAEAYFYAEQAASFGSTNAYAGMSVQHRLGLGVEQDIEKAAELVKIGALKGSTSMRVLMGIYYREGWGVPQSYGEARRWFDLAANVGNVSAFSAIGDMYKRGQLGEANPTEALIHYRKAATLGQTDALNSVGMAYLNGEGVEKDTEVGMNFLSQASALGNPHAAFQLGRAFWRGNGVEKNPAQALAFFRLAAQRNNLVAYVLVGDVMKSQGNGPEAMANYIIAREGGALRDTKAARNVSQIAVERLANLDLSSSNREAGEALAAEWIEQFGLLDFNLVNE